MDHGRLAGEFLSSEGVRQGDVLASLLFALSMRDAYSSSIKDLDCQAVAVMDDFYLLGPPSQVLAAFDRFSSGLPPLGLTLNLPKSSCLIPSLDDTDIIRELSSRNLPYSNVFIPALGTIISRNPDILSDWLKEQVSTLHEPFFKALLDPRLPSQHAFALLRHCLVPRMNYFSRITAPSTFSAAALAFDKLLVDTFCLPSDLLEPLELLKDPKMINTPLDAPPVLSFFTCCFRMFRRSWCSLQRPLLQD
jgi:hypothetical protein